MDEASSRDEQLQRDILAELAWDSRVASNEIGVIVIDGIVTLAGHVASFYKKWAAEEAAHRVRGVKAVANNIQVRLHSTAERSDDELAAAAVLALEQAGLGGHNLKVTVADRWLTVKGEVEWNFQREEAELALHRVWGVKGVTNMLTVSTRPTAHEIKQKIEEALVRNAELDARHIQVEVAENRVILKGKVRSWVEREEAERAAWIAPGITAVDDQIQVVYC